MNTDAHGFKQGELTGQIIRIFYDVYNELGYGFLESVYEKAMCIALAEVGLTVACQRDLAVHFRGHVVGEFTTDIIVNDCVLIELKAARGFDSSHESQTLNYLRATTVEVGLLLNFGPKPEFKRFVFDNDRKALRATP